MYLQPKVALPERCIVGAEALVRWISPEGMLCPNEFVPLFERDGVIAELISGIADRWRVSMGVEGAEAPVNVLAP